MQKRTVDNLLKKGTLTGDKAGKLELQEYIRRLNGEAQIFSEAEGRQLINSIKDSEGIKAYNGYIELCKILHGFDLMAKLQSLYAQKKLFAINALAQIFSGKQILQISQAITPVIMTEKEYEEKNKEYYKEALKKTYDLETIFLDRVYYYVENHKTLIPKLWKQYEEEKKEGRKKDSSLLYGTDLLGDIYYYYTSEYYGIEGFKEDFPDLFDIIYNDLDKLFKANKLKANKPFSKIPLKDYHKIKFMGKGVLKTGLPEVEKFFELDMEYSFGIAIVRKPAPSDLDKNGYYMPDTKKKYLEYSQLEKKLKDEKQEIENFNSSIDKVINSIKEFYIYYDIANSISSLVGMKFKEVLKQEEEILEIADLYNEVVKGLNRLIKEYRVIDLNSLKPTKEKQEKLTKYLKSIQPSEYRNLSEAKILNIYSELNETAEPKQQDEAPEVLNEQ